MKTPTLSSISNTTISQLYILFINQYEKLFSKEMFPILKRFLFLGRANFVQQCYKSFYHLTMVLYILK